MKLRYVLEDRDFEPDLPDDLETDEAELDRELEEMMSRRSIN